MKVYFHDLVINAYIIMCLLVVAVGAPASLFSYQRVHHDVSPRGSIGARVTICSLPHDLVINIHIIICLLVVL